MCGIFGIIANRFVSKKDLTLLALISRERGRDSSGYIVFDNLYSVYKFDQDIKKTVNKIFNTKCKLIIGHSRLITNSTEDNQPILRKSIAVVHNGIIINHNEIFLKYKLSRKFQIDTEILPVLINYYIKKNISYNQIIDKIFKNCIGTISCAAVLPQIGKMFLFSNNGSLYSGIKNDNYYFASEKFFLEKIQCMNIIQVTKTIIDIPKHAGHISQIDNKKNNRDLVPGMSKLVIEENILIYKDHNLKRCTKCILPSTMPFIKFDTLGICNYCKNYSKINFQKFNSIQTESLFNSYKNTKGIIDCIIPLSGGRDSCVALHLAKQKFHLNPIAYTYDWGLVTDLARRNISRMCSKLNVENIIFADDISRKRKYIRNNVIAWLKNPHLGMVNLFTAGDKHFFRHVETVKKRTGIKLDLWGINPYEVTHFKSGFLNIPPEFETKSVYNSGILRQLEYHKKRFYQMLRNPSYFNLSIFDNLYGEFYRSIKKKTNHYSIFDFWKWNEKEVEKILDDYDWERSVDTKSTWRIGDGAAAFYNYIYYTLAGFSEHDTFRSNQIREGDLSRTDAMELIKIENKPRYENLKWFLKVINLDYEKTIRKINQHSLQDNII